MKRKTHRKETAANQHIHINIKYLVRIRKQPVQHQSQIGPRRNPSDFIGTFIGVLHTVHFKYRLIISFPHNTLQWLLDFICRSRTDTINIIMYRSASDRIQQRCHRNLHLRY